MSSREEQKAQARAEREARERAELRAAQRRKRLWQLGAVLGVAVVAVVALIFLGQKSKTTPNASGGAPVAGTAEMRAMLRGIPQHGSSLGDPKAPLVLTEFADLQCPYCGQYATNVLPQVIERYVRTGKLRLELRLRDFLGPDSDTAARAAQAAAGRNRMWNFTDAFYRNQGQENSGYVTDDFLARIATAAGVPAKLAVDGSKSPALKQPALDADAQAQAAGLPATPAFVIGPKAGEGKALDVSRLDFESFAAAIDPELER
jgi:protein-disulfide isomerase